MKTLLDCGAYTGDSVPTLVKGYGPFDRIVCFEANPFLEIAIPEASTPNVKLIRAAVWTQEGELRFFFGATPRNRPCWRGKGPGS